MCVKLTIISLGWGVQSWALAAMVALGELPMVDAVVHSDTTYERQATYDFAAKWTPWLEDHGVRVITVYPEKNAKIIENGNSIMIPAYTTRSDGKPSGMLRRQCTNRWKIQPVRKWIRGELERLSVPKRPGVVNQWLGITLDEIQRVKPANVKYIKNTYPFLDMLSFPWSRATAIKWLLENDLDIPVKSSCVFCPFHDRASWREIKIGPHCDWDKVLQIDSAIRNRKPRFVSYLTNDRVPINEIDFRNEQDLGQMSMFDSECYGACFL